MDRLVSFDFSSRTDGLGASNGRSDHECDDRSVRNGHPIASVKSTCAGGSGHDEQSVSLRMLGGQSRLRGTCDQA